MKEVLIKVESWRSMEIASIWEFENIGSLLEGSKGGEDFVNRDQGTRCK